MVFSLVFLHGRYTSYILHTDQQEWRSPPRPSFEEPKNDNIQDKTGMFSAKYS